MSLAAVRWLANSIENLGIELYATDRESFPEIERVLRSTLEELRGIRVQFAVSEEENGCPDGYVLCHGICAPSCDDFDASAEAGPEARAAARQNRKSDKTR
jgi:hypothetical protein